MGEKGYSPHFHTETSRKPASERQGITLSGPKSPPRASMLQSSTSFKTEFPQKATGSKKCQPCCKYLKSLSHGSEDMKPLENTRGGSPSPLTPGRPGLSITTGSSSPTASRWWAADKQQSGTAAVSGGISH